jgi:hypothetical protein
MKYPLIKERDILVFMAGMWSAATLGILAVVLLLGLASCAASHPAAPLPPLAPVDVATVQHLDSLTLQNWLPSDLAGLPPYLVPAPAGSTPKQRRQWQKAQTRNLARAGVQPTKIKNSSVASAPGATAINRPAAPVATGSGAATDARKAGQRGGASAVGPGALATATSSHGPPWWVYLVVAVFGAVGWELLSAKVAPVRQLLRWRIA